MKKFKASINLIFVVGTLIAVGYAFYFLESRSIDVWFIVMFSFYIINSLFILGLFSQHRHSGAKLSWIIIMTALPIFGHFIFLLFGRRYPKRQTREEYLAHDEFKFESKKENLNIKSEVKTLFNKQSIMSGRGVYNGNFEFFNSGILGFKSMFDDMRNAKKFLHIHFYIIHPGEIYDEFKSILIEKVKQGVEVRLIVDDFGRWAMPWYQIKELKEHGVKVGIFGKVSFLLIGSKNGYRTHRKCVIIDGKEVHTGGMNIGDEYAGLSNKYGKWLDFQFKLTGEAVRSYNILFAQDWRLLENQALSEKYIKVKTSVTGNSQTILVEDGPYIREHVIAQSFVSWILNAKESIHISTPYFVPTVTILEALSAALNSGVKVSIYIPGKADKQTVLVATKYWASELQKQGASIYQTNGMLLHSKMGLFDDKYAYVGTTNIDMRSLYSQFEFISLMTGESVKGIKEEFDNYKKMSTLLTSDDLKTSKYRHRLLRIFASIFAPIM